ncbi:hypothetical protein RCZ15_14960 [Capnocytophaga catalasegens]|uniref:F0F1-ATPase subunit n=1 Tax=Capnocytophaga catalasegens TaxID=1004260 RepID=A0AAV5AZD8_9FLAO|nr:hypothetical protein RCZ03_22910 [Capnocytophaga catalasegens]GJM50523.1 hypothetical protein RCZ15_14960 [Capnocytophaga catalasegens]GJM53202.1 hypothetical protein RCZ16_15190 [Capnocytophaga catalasegens]
MKKQINNWIKFSQIGLQMAITIALCAYLGDWLDKKYPVLAPWGIVGISLFGVFASLYNVIKQVEKMDN